MREPVRKFKETVEMRASVFNRIRSHRYFSVGLLVSAVLLASCVHVWQRVRVLALVTEVSQLESDNASLLDDATKLNADIAALSMASRIERYAKDTLGLRSVSSNRIFTLVKERHKDSKPDELAVMLKAMERVTQHMPVISESRAVAEGLRRIKFDSSATEGEGR